MNNKRLFSVILSLSMIFASLPVFAENVPTVAELEDQINKDTANSKKLKDVISVDYSNVITGSDDLTIEINENSVRKLNRGVVGLQCELGNQEHLTVYKDGDYRPDLIKLMHESEPIPLVRFGGTTTSRHNYMKAGVGPVDKRSVSNTLMTSIGTDYIGGPALTVGIPEMIKLFQMNNKDVGFVMCVGPLMDADTVIDFTHYLLDDKNESEWGALRAADGIEEPVNIAYWELGNELDGSADLISDERIQWYIDWALPVAKAIKEEYKDQKVVFCGKTAAWDAIKYSPDHPAYRMKWEKRIFEKIAPYVDGITFHPYYDGYSSEYMMKIADMTKKSMDEEVERQQIKDENGNLKDMIMVITECNRWSSQTINNTDFYSAVCTSHWLNNCFERDWIVGTAYHNAFTNFPYWCMFWGKKDDRYYKGPSVKLYDLYLREMGDRIIDSNVIFPDDDTEEVDPYEPRNFSAFVTAKGDNELKVILTNREAYTCRNIKFNFNNKYKLIKETIFTAPNAAVISIDKEAEDSIKIIENEKDVSDFTEYQMNGLGVVVLTLKTNSKIGNTDMGDNDEIVAAPEATDISFSDIDNTFSKNEIMALYNMGIISGKDISRFCPDDLLKNSELASMLAKVLNLKTDYKGSHWRDVSSDRWYSGAANALYIENVWTGELFEADKIVTVESLMNILGKYLTVKNGVDIGSVEIDDSRLNSYGTYCIKAKLFDNILKRGDIVLSKGVTRAEASDILYRFYSVIGR